MTFIDIKTIIMQIAFAELILSMINIDVTEALKQPGKIFKYEYEGLPTFDDIIFAEPLSLNAEFVAFNNEIRLTGKYNTKIFRECVRCLDRTIELAENEFDETFVRGNDADNYSYDENVVSLDKMLYDDIMLKISPNPICDESCRGLCPNCGADLNKEACGCADINTEDEDNPFSKLQDLFK